MHAIYIKLPFANAQVMFLLSTVPFIVCAEESWWGILSVDQSSCCKSWLVAKLFGCVVVPVHKSRLAISSPEELQPRRLSGSSFCLWSSMVAQLVMAWTSVSVLIQLKDLVRTRRGDRTWTYPFLKQALSKDQEAKRREGEKAGRKRLRAYRDRRTWTCDLRLASSESRGTFYHVTINHFSL